MSQAFVATMDRFQPVLVVLLRVFFGSMMALVLSVIGIGIAWGLFVFAGATTRLTLISMLLGGAGIGAGAGCFVAWIRLQGDTPVKLVALALAALLAGIGGAWAGYQYGAGVEVECCAIRDVTPLSYTAAGATLVTNSVALLIWVGRELLFTWRRTNLG